MKWSEKVFSIVVICSCLVFANAWLQWLVDSDLGMGWPHICIRNWHQFGFFTLKGQLVSNPGGHDALLHPQIYAGHRAASLYLPFVVSSVFSWTGSNALPFHALLSAAVLVSVWRLLGGTATALLAGALAILSPGFVVEPTVLDPNAISELLAIPYAVFLWQRLRKPQCSLKDLVLILVITACFSALNWTTALAHAQILVGLLATKTVSRSRMVLYLVSGALSALLVLLLSVLSKASGGMHQAGAFLEFLSGYTWGRSGYGYDTNTGPLLWRFAFVNLLALLPVWVFLAWNWGRCVKSSTSSLFWSFTPILVALLEVLALRNYFCHHPWMGAPHMLLAAVLSLLVLRSSMVADHERMLDRYTLGRGLSVACVLGLVFVFSFLMVSLYREHDRSELTLVSMVRENTARGDVVAMATSQDPETHKLANLLPEQLDRSIVLTDALPDLRHPAPASFLLSPVPLDSSWTLIGQTAGASLTRQPLVQRLTEWYMHKVARRKPVEWLTLADHYYLYRVPQNIAAISVVHSDHAR